MNNWKNQNKDHFLRQKGSESKNSSQLAPDKSKYTQDVLSDPESDDEPIEYVEEEEYDDEESLEVMESIEIDYSSLDSSFCTSVMTQGPLFLKSLGNAISRDAELGAYAGPILAALKLVNGYLVENERVATAQQVSPPMAAAGGGGTRASNSKLASHALPTPPSSSALSAHACIYPKVTLADLEDFGVGPEHIHRIGLLAFELASGSPNSTGAVPVAAATKMTDPQSAKGYPTKPLTVQIPPKHDGHTRGRPTKPYDAPLEPDDQDPFSQSGNFNNYSNSFHSGSDASSCASSEVNIYEDEQDYYTANGDRSMGPSAGLAQRSGSYYESDFDNDDEAEEEEVTATASDMGRVPHASQAGRSSQAPLHEAPTPATAPAAGTRPRGGPADGTTSSVTTSATRATSAPAAAFRDAPLPTSASTASVGAAKSKRTATPSWITKRRWTLGERIGCGTFGEVFQGMSDTGRLFAVKRLHIAGQKHAVDALANEIGLMRAFSHPNIVAYLGVDIDEAAGVVNIFQEWVSGGSLAHLLSRFGPFKERAVVNYARQILAGLAFLHASGIIHRDIKGGNVLVDETGHVKLADFGASTRVNSLTEATVESLDIKGTPYFMAPEVLGRNKYGRKGDIWAVGCTVIQMLTAQPPWKDQQLAGLVQLHMLLERWQGPPTYPREQVSRSS